MRVQECFDPFFYNLKYSLPIIVFASHMGRVLLREPYKETVNADHMTLVIEGIPGGGKSELCHALSTISKGVTWMKNSNTTFQSLDIL